jgi:hypothetical protein
LERRREEDESEAKGRVGCRLELGDDVVDGMMPPSDVRRGRIRVKRRAQCAAAATTCQRLKL